MKRILLGFLAALVLGGGAGAAIAPVAQRMAPARLQDTRPPAIDPGKVVVESVKGEVQMLDRAGEWVGVVSASRVSRPVRLRTVGADGEVSLAFRGVRVVAAMQADFMLSAPGPEPSILVSDGHVRIHRGANPLQLFVPDREIKLTGKTFGVYVQAKAVTVAVLDGELEVQAPGRKPIKFARGRELAITARRLMPAVLDKQLSIEVQGTSRRGYRYTLTGRTAPHARVVHTDDDKREKLLDVSPAGIFSVNLLDRRPPAGTLVAFDAAGRRAEVDRPSQTLDEVVAALTGGIGSPKPAAAETPAKAEPEPEPAAPNAPASPAPEPAPAAEPAPAPKAPAEVAPREPKKAAPAREAARKPAPRTKARGKRPPEPVKLELGGGDPKMRSPGLKIEKPEVELGTTPGKVKAKPKPTPKAKPAPKPDPEPAGDEEAL